MEQSGSRAIDRFAAYVFPDHAVEGPDVEVCCFGEVDDQRLFFQSGLNKTLIGFQPDLGFKADNKES